MFDVEVLRRAVELQKRSYALLRWVARAVDRGFIAFEAAHAYATLPDAAAAWISEHHANLPPEARPPRSDLEPFARFFATYLETSFELVRDPGKQLYSPDAHCFCPMCSWLVDAPRLRTKKVHPADKRRANRKMLNAARAIADQHDVVVEDEAFSTWLRDERLGPALALLAYADDLLARGQGRTEGAVTLALWRRFAWTSEGSPRKDFELTTEAILAAEATVRERIAAMK